MTQSRLPFLLLFFRAATISSRFSLIGIISFYLSLEELGKFGLITGIAAIAPVLLGFGWSNHISRTAVLGDRASTVRALRATWLCVSAVYVILGTLIVALNTLVFGGFPQYSSILLISALLLCWLEQLSQDQFLLLVTLDRPIVANATYLFRSALPVILLLLFVQLFPHLIAIEFIVVLMVVSNFVSVVMFFALTRAWAWGVGLFGTRFADIPSGSRYLYFNDIVNVSGQYVDRFIIGAYLSLEVAGIYFLFWSAGNAVTTLVSSAIVHVKRASVIRAARVGRKLEGEVVAKVVREGAIGAIVLGAAAAAALYGFLLYSGKTRSDLLFSFYVYCSIGCRT